MSVLSYKLINLPTDRLHALLQEEERRGGKKGRLLGIITLSDVLRYLIGESGSIGEGAETTTPTQDAGLVSVAESSGNS